MGSQWSRRDVRFPTEKWAQWVSQVDAHEGVVTLDMGPNWDPKAGPDRGAGRSAGGAGQGDPRGAGSGAFIREVMDVGAFYGDRLAGDRSVFCGQSGDHLFPRCGIVVVVGSRP